jgi:hypothetical protein
LLLQRRASACSIASSADGVLVAGMQLHFPAFSRLAQRGGAYALVPESWVHRLDGTFGARPISVQR